MAFDSFGQNSPDMAVFPCFPSSYKAIENFLGATLCRATGSVLLAAHSAALAGGSALEGTRRPGRHPARRQVRDEEAEELEDLPFDLESR